MSSRVSKESKNRQDITRKNGMQMTSGPNKTLTHNKLQNQNGPESLKTRQPAPNIGAFTISPLLSSPFFLKSLLFLYKRTR